MSTTCSTNNYNALYKIIIRCSLREYVQNGLP